LIRREGKEEKAERKTVLRDYLHAQGVGRKEIEFIALGRRKWEGKRGKGERHLLPTPPGGNLASYEVRSVEKRMMFVSGLLSVVRRKKTKKLQGAFE